ncbi:MAG TPA: nuclear transport factor 2 family protein [Jatrophihabitans sp.]|jgi:hypothetical protein|nr:nuclear transport factor 2 family protein [Jatrophihabitans sp.]
MHRFRAAIEARDVDAAVALLTEDVEFRSPVVFSPYRGRDPAAVLLHAVARIFDDFRYTREIGDSDGRDHALVFQARIGDRRVEGCDFLHSNQDGMIDELVVMIRPLSGALALAEAMQAQLTKPEAINVPDEVQHGRFGHSLAETTTPDANASARRRT